MPTTRKERKSPVRAVSDFLFLIYFPSCFYHGMQVKSSPSSHKLAGRFIFYLTFSLEMPPGTWASALWWEMTRLLLGMAVVKSNSLASSPLSPILFSTFSFSLWSFSASDDSHFKGQGSRLFHRINFNIIPIYHIQHPGGQSSKITAGR